MAFRKIDYSAAVHKYNVPLEAMLSCLKAHRWAKKVLTEKEGSGHQFSLYRTKKGLIGCSFAKAEWAGDHSGGDSHYGSLAIVKSVIEYLEGE